MNKNTRFRKAHIEGQEWVWYCNNYRGEGKRVKMGIKNPNTGKWVLVYPSEVGEAKESKDWDGDVVKYYDVSPATVKDYIVKNIIGGK